MRAEAAQTGVARLPRLTALRALAAFMVFGFHVLAFFPGQAQPGLGLLFGQGRSGVTFFFVLSGFVLSWAARPGARALTFYRHRFVRVYPAYLVAIVFAATLWAARTPSALLHGVLTPFLLQSWIPDSRFYFGLDVPAWSLSDEAFFYALMPLLIPLTRRSRRRTVLIAMVACVVVPAVAASIAGLSTTAATLGANTVAVWAAFYCPLIRLPEFVLGVLAAELLRRGAMPPIPLWLGASLAAVAYLACGVFPSVFGVVAIPLVPFAALIVAAAQADLRGTTGMLRARLLVGLGSGSYCFYLVHHIFVIRLDQPGFARYGLNGPMGALVALALSCVAAWLLHRLVEVPAARRWRGAGSEDAAPTDDAPSLVKAMATATPSSGGR